MSRKLWAAVALGSVLAVRAAAAGDLVGMHDFDQKRQGLPTGGQSGKPGGGYCVPTSIANEMYFLEDHGYTTLLPGLTDPGQFAEVTASIATLGAYIGTGAGSSTAAVSEISAYLTGVDVLRPNSDWFMLTSVAYGAIPWNDVTFANIKSWFDSLSLITVVLRKYDDSNAPNLVKVSGHQVTLVGLNKTGTGSYEVRYHDPFVDESPDDLGQQSSYHTEEITMQDEAANYDGKFAILMREVGGDRRAIDSFLVIKPYFVLSDFTNPLTNVSASDEEPGEASAGAVFTVTTPGNARLGGAETVTIPHQAAARDIALHPAAPRAAYIEQGSNAIWETHLVDGNTRVLAMRRAPRRLTYGGPRPTLFVLDGRQIVALQPNGRPSHSATPPARVDDLAYDLVRDRLVAVSASADTLFYYDEELHLRGRDALPHVPGDGVLEVATDARSERLWLHRNGSRLVVAVGYDHHGKLYSYRVELQTTASPMGLAVADRGFLITSEHGALQAYDLTGARSARTPVAGIPSGPAFAIPRDFDNYDVRVMGEADNPPTEEE
jgi:hypothetical protein